MEEHEEQRQWTVWLVTRFLSHDDVRFRAGHGINDCINAMKLMHKFQDFDIRILDKYFFRTPDDKRLCSTKYRGLFVPKELTKDKLATHIVLSKRKAKAVLAWTHLYVHRNFGKLYPTEHFTDTLSSVYDLYSTVFHEARHFGDYLYQGYMKWSYMIDDEAHKPHAERSYEKKAFSFSSNMLKRFTANAYLYIDWYEDSPERECKETPWKDIMIF